MKHPPKKYHYQRKPLEPEWEDEAPTPEKEDKLLKQREEERLFREAIEKGPMPPKKREPENQKQALVTKTTKKKSNRHEIDLHGLTVSEAQNHVIRAINHILEQVKGQPVDIRIITGKGNHSQGRQPQLISSIHHIVESRFRDRLIHIEASPHELKLGETYLKGHFDLRIK